MLAQPVVSGGVPTGDPDVSPDQTFPGWLSPVALGQLMSSGYPPSAMVPELMGTHCDAKFTAKTRDALSVHH